MRTRANLPHRLTTLETAPLRSAQLAPSSAVTVFAITWQKSRHQAGYGKVTATTPPRRSFGTTGQAAHWEWAAACSAYWPFLFNKAVKPTQMSGSAEWPNDGVLHDSFGVTIFADQVQKPRQPCGSGQVRFQHMR